MGAFQESFGKWFEFRNRTGVVSLPRIRVISPSFDVTLPVAMIMDHAPRGCDHGGQSLRFDLE